ncbi:DUF998 domain-containing protein [Leucobacter aridicollis]|uniref:DUF998 domain-containing protein n=1 Tax=Leucobacter aridicollis TaxID=283878 RepID=UPI002166D474|nr:DUF998 domain-containing protein [Leucobacter aridicollis]MCS3428293.1 putative membrane protein [Leucobacter aridicollis]
MPGPRQGWRFRPAGSGSAAIESRATQLAVGAFVVAAILTTLLMLGRRLPLAGEGSLGNIAAWCAGAGAGLAYLLAHLVETKRGLHRWRGELPRAKRIFDAFALTLATGMLAYLGIMAIASLFQLGFQGLTVDPVGGGVLAGAAAAAMTYIGALVGSRVTSESIALLATLQLFTGTMASMVSSPDASWWQLHFSQLGNEAGQSGYRFNVSLIITGFVLIALSNYIGNDVRRGLVARDADDPKLVGQLSWLFAAIGICMAIAGAVPDAENIVVHVGAASGMLVVFAVLVFVSLRRIVDVPRELAVFSLIVVVGIVVAVLLWVPFGYYNLTGTEFMAASLLFAWLTVYVRTLAAYAVPRGIAPAASGLDRGTAGVPAAPKNAERTAEDDR